MAAEYQIELYRPELRAGVLALQHHHWGGDRELNQRYFEWKYERNPYLDEVLIFVATTGGEIVGMRGAYGARWIDGGGRSLDALGAGDLVVRPDHRNRFLPRRIMAASAAGLASRGYRCLVNLSASSFTYLTSLRQGWTLVQEHRPAVRSIERKLPRRLLDGLLRSLGHDLLSDREPFATFDRAVARGKGTLSPAISIERGTRPDAMVELCAKAAASTPSVRHVRDRSFFSWRFENPFSSYRFLYWQQASTLSAYLVLHQPVREGRNVIRLADWAFTSPVAFEELVRSAVELSGRLGHRVSLGGLDDLERGILERAGFVPMPIAKTERYRPGVLVKKLGTETATADAVALDQAIAGAWRYRMIDSDGL